MFVTWILREDPTSGELGEDEETLAYQQLLEEQQGRHLGRVGPFTSAFKVYGLALEGPTTF